MPKLKPGPIVPTPVENVGIDAGIRKDEDNPEWAAKDFAAAKPASEFFDAQTHAALVSLKRPRGRPRTEEHKVLTALRLDADIVSAFKSTGKGWQTKMNAALRQYIAEHPIKH